MGNPSKRVTPIQLVFIAIFAYGICFFIFGARMHDSGAVATLYENAPVENGRDNPHARQLVDGTVLSATPEWVGSGKGRHEVFRVAVSIEKQAMSTTVKPDFVGLLPRGDTTTVELYLHNVARIGQVVTLENPTAHYQDDRKAFWMCFGFMTLFVSIAALSCFTRIGG
jgi:hypothetical protein